MKAKKYTCLQLTSRTVRLVELIRGNGHLKRLREDVRHLPAGVNHPLVNPATVEMVNELVSDAKRRGQKVFVSISSNEVLLKWIELPQVIPQASADKQRLAIETMLTTENYIPVPLERAAYDFHLMNPTSLLLGWMRQGALAEVCESLREVGVEMVYLTPQPVALATQLLSEIDSEERVCGIYIDKESCDLVVIEGGVIYCGRSFPAGDSADLWGTMRQTLGSCPNPKDTPLRRMVLFQGTDKLLRPPEGMWDCEMTEATFDWPRALLMPILRVEDSRNGDEDIGLNLLVPLRAKQAAQQKRTRKRRLSRLIPVAAMLLLLVANVKLFDAIESKKDRIDALQRDRVSAKTLQTETESLQKQYAAVEDALEQLAWGERHFPPLAKRLTQIANHIPALVRLTEIQTLPPPRGAKAYAAFDARQTLRLIGVARTQTEIDAFRVALVAQPEFSSVRQVKTEQTTIGGEKWLTFTLSLISTPSLSVLGTAAGDAL